MCLLLTACSAAPVQESAEPTAAPEETAAEETQPKETTAPEEDSVFIVGTTAEILTANRSEYNFDVISGTLSQLAPVWLDENGDYQPLLCDYATEDSKTWALTVREGMTWHDGQPVTAEDIAFTLTFLDAQEGGGYADRYENIEVADERTINLTLPAANPRELANLTVLRILPKHIYDGVEDYASVPNEQANIGCGPYRYARFDADAGVIEFDAVENYPDGQPAFDQVLVQLFDSEDTLYSLLNAEPFLTDCTAVSGYIYEDGSFQAYGTNVSGKSYEYQLGRYVKGAFSEVTLNIGNAEDYEEWIYTTSRGDEVQLSLGPSRCVVMSDQPKAFVAINLLGGTEGNSFFMPEPVTKEDLEAFAELFDFAKLG